MALVGRLRLRDGSSFLAPALLAAALVMVPGCSEPAPAGVSQEIEQKIDAARKLFQEEGPKRALPEFESILAGCIESGDKACEARLLGHLGICYRRLGDLEKALDFQKRSLALKERLGDRPEQAKTLGNIGLVYWELGDYPRAVESLKEGLDLARETGETGVEASIRNNLGLVFDELGKYDQSIEQYQAALRIHRELGNRENESAILGNLGGVQLMLGRYSDALKEYEEAYRISLEMDLKPSAAADLVNLARCRAGLGELQTALQLLDQSLAISREAGLMPEEADARLGRGNVLYQLGEYGAALAEYRGALGVYESGGLKKEEHEALNQIGLVYLRVGDLESAAASFGKAAQLAREIDYQRGEIAALVSLGRLKGIEGDLAASEDHLDRALEQSRAIGDLEGEAESLLELAGIAVRNGDRRAAREQGQSALDLARRTGYRHLEAEAMLQLSDCLRDQGDQDQALQWSKSAEPIAGDVGDPELVWRLWWGRGRIHVAAGRRLDAREAFEKSVGTIESVRFQLPLERYRAGYIEDRYQPYLDLIRILLGDNQMERAFWYSERLRAKAFRDSTGLSSPIRDAVARQEEAALRQRIEELRKSLESEARKPENDQRGEASLVFRRELADAERAYQDFIDDLTAREPSAAAVLDLKIPELSDLQRRIGPDEAVLEYLVLPDEVVVFALRADRMEASRTSVDRNSLESRVELLLDLVGRGSGDEWQTPARGLASILLDPVFGKGILDGVKRLYVVPHGCLHRVPFAVLTRDEASGPRCLVESFVLTELASAASKQASGQGFSARRENGNELLLVAPASSRLRYAGEEVRDLARMEGAGATLLAGSDASEPDVVRLAPHFRRVHFATHGFFNRRFPLLSGIQLEPGLDEDGRLEVHEIRQLRLDSDLVVLSACDTGRGTGYFADHPVGDDVMGLAQAFLFAGSRSVAASLWDLNDRSTFGFMRSFYRSLTTGSPPAEALAQAQRQAMRSGGPLGHPYHWAAFILFQQ